MRELLRTNDPVLLSYVEALLRDTGLLAIVLDGHMSATEGSIGMLPRRMMVAAEDWEEATGLLADAGLGQWTIADEP